MPNSTASKAKVSKPRPDFPLFPHATRRWAKKVRGKLVYFGKTTDDPQGEKALNQWLDQKDELLAGRTPRTGVGATVEDICNQFLAHKEELAQGRRDHQEDVQRIPRHRETIAKAMGNRTPD